MLRRGRKNLIRGIRGATTVSQDTEQEIIEAVVSLMTEIIEKNHVEPEAVASVFFSATEDLSSVFPAKALRKLDGWKYVPVTCMSEISVEGSLQKCIRVMVHVNTNKSQKDIQHVYQEGAQVLRPDLNN